MNDTTLCSTQDLSTNKELNCHAFKRYRLCVTLKILQLEIQMTAT